MKDGKCENKCFNQKHSTRVLFSIVLLFGVVTLQASTAGAQPIAKVDEQLEPVILAEDWGKVVNMLSDVNEPNLPAPLRLVKGHACLATNRNNESLCLFLNTSSKKDLKEWQKWSQDFATKYPASPIAHYFKGDSYARLGQWDKAISDFNIALKIDPNHPLVLNARGATYATKGRWDKALLDLCKVVHTKPDFADPYASLGALAIQQKEGAKGAIEDFNKALGISPDFAIAMYGRGVVQFVLGKREESKEDINKSRQATSCLSNFISGYVDEALERIIGVDKIELARADGENPSMAIESRIAHIAEKGTLGRLGLGPIGGKQWRDASRIAYSSGDEKAITKFEDYTKQIIANNPSNPLVGPSMHNYLQRHKYAHETKALNFSGTTTMNKVSGEFGGAGPIGPAIVGGKVGFEHTTTSDLTPRTDFHADAAQTLDKIHNNIFGKSSAQGFKTSLEEATWDEGNWPFDPLYGLFYKIESPKTSPTNTEETEK